MGQTQAKEFPYAIGERVSGDPDALWAMHDGTAKSDGAPVTIFAFDAAARQDRLAAARNAFKRLKTMRHPCILRFIDGVELPTTIYMVTEHVRPLPVALRASDANERTAEAAAAWGLHQLARALSFLNGDCKAIHGDVCPWSVFVDRSGEWKLGGFDAMAGPEEECDFGLIPAHMRYRAPEIARQGRANRRNAPHAPDAWGLATVIWETFNGPLDRAEAMSDAGRIPRSLVPRFRDLSAPNARARASAAQFLRDAMQESGFLRNPFVEASQFLEELQIKEPGEKADFFRRLPDMMDAFPPDACRHKYFPLLIGAIEFGAGGSQALTSLLKAAKWVSGDEYERKVVPVVVRLFSSTDRALRMQLLQHIDQYGEHLKPAVVDQQVFPQVMNGFADASPVLREQTVKSMIALAPKLSERTINNHLLRNFAKLQMDEEPGIRTNTTICLGKIAPHFSDVTRKKVLIPAFLRAMRDPFPPARSAGILSLVATQQFYGSDDIATKIVPSLGPMMVDPERDVRNHAFSALRGFIARVEAGAPEANGTHAAAGSSAQSGAAGGAADAQQGWAGWAYSSVNLVAKKLISSRTGSEGGAAAGPTGAPTGEPARPPSAQRASSSDHVTTPRTEAPSRNTSSHANMTSAQENAVLAALERPDTFGAGRPKAEPEESWEGGDWDSGWDASAPKAQGHSMRASEKAAADDGWDNDSWEPLEDTPAPAPAPKQPTRAAASDARTSSAPMRLGPATPQSQQAHPQTQTQTQTQRPPCATAAPPATAVASRTSTAAPQPINWAATVPSGASSWGDAPWDSPADAPKSSHTAAASGKPAAAAKKTEGSGWDDADDDGGWDSAPVKKASAVSVSQSAARPSQQPGSASAPMSSVPSRGSTGSGTHAPAASQGGDGWGDWGDDGADGGAGDGDKAEAARRRAEERRQRQLAQREERARAAPKKAGLGAVRMGT